MNSIIIQRILMHMMDFEHNHIYYADDFLSLTPMMQEYYDKKVEKAWNSSKKTEISVGDFHSLIIRSTDMLENHENFFKHAHTITEELFELGRKINLIPNCNILFIECMIDGVKHMVIIKLNYKIIPVNVIEQDENGKQVVRITNQQMLPSKSAPVEEAIMINIEDKRLWLIEKRFEIDGKLDYYLNEQYIKGEALLTDNKVMKLLNKTIEKVEDQYSVNDFEPQALVKQELVNCLLDHKDIIPTEIASNILSRDYEAETEALGILNDLGIDENTKITSAINDVDRLSKCKIVTDTDMSITVSVDAYINEDKIKKVHNEDGSYSIILNDIHEIVVK